MHDAWEVIVTTCNGILDNITNPALKLPSLTNFNCIKFWLSLTLNFITKCLKEVKILQPEPII